MTVYALQKAIREVNRDAATRARFMQAPDAIAQEYELTARERSALVERDYGALYALGVHGLLLRPFSILHGVPEPDYLRAIRQEP